MLGATIIIASPMATTLVAICCQPNRHLPTYMMSSINRPYRPCNPEMDAEATDDQQRHLRLELNLQYPSL